MGNLSLIFHLTSLVLFGFLSFLIMGQSVRLKTWRDWNVPDAAQRVLVGEPVRVLRTFAKAVGADFETEIAENYIPAVRLSLKSLFEVHRRGLITRITVKKAPQPCVCFVLGHKPGTIGVDHAVISRDLGDRLGVEFVDAHSQG